jgi:hypothetical protein
MVLQLILTEWFGILSIDVALASHYGAELKAFLEVEGPMVTGQV